MRVDAEVEQLTEHERRLGFGGRSYRTLTAVQDTDLLVEVNGVPHRVSRDEGGLVRSHAPGVVVAIPVSEGDEVQAGDVVAITETMKMETSLTAPVNGRVREVLVGANVHVAAGRPLLQIEPLEDAPAAADGERADLRARRGATLDDLERLGARARLRRAPASTRVDGAARREGERRLLELYADVRVAQPPARRRRGRRGRSPQEHLHAFLRSLDPDAEGLPERFVAQPRARARALRHRRPRAHGRARGRRLPAVPVPAARGARARRGRAILDAPARARRAGDDALRGVLDRLEARSARASRRWPSWRASCAGAARRAAGRGGAARRRTSRWRSTSPRWPRIPAATTATSTWPRSSTARSRSRRCSAATSAPPARWWRR